MTQAPTVRKQYWPSPRYKPVAFDPPSIRSARRARQIARALEHPPRKIRRWLRETGAQYDLGSRQWYVPRREGRGEVSRPRRRQRLVRREPPIRGTRPRRPPPGPRIEPPVDWPITHGDQIADRVRRFIEALEHYERLPIEARDPSDDFVVGRLVLIVVVGKVALRLSARVLLIAAIWYLRHSRL